MTVIAEVVDPDERRVQLTSERWEHILNADDGHPELVEHRAAVIRAVSAPDQRRPGRRSNEQWYFLRDAAPAAGCRWS